MNDIATSRVGGDAADAIAYPRYGSVGEGLDAAEAARARGEAAIALQILDWLAREFPDQPVPLLRASAILSQQRRFDKAEALLADGAARFPNDVGFAVERAWTAQRRGNLDEAAARFACVRELLPNHPTGFTGGATVLRDRGDFAGADALLREASERFPKEAGPVIEFAWVAQIKRDWPEAAGRWLRVRKDHGNYAVGYTAGATALRELGRLDEAMALLDEALRRFPNDGAPIVERAWLAHQQRDWNTAIALWEELRRRFPAQIAGYNGGAQALREAGRIEEAEAIVAAGVNRFPADPGLAVEYAALAARRRNWTEATRRWESVRTTFPEHSASYTGAAQALREQRRFDEADAILVEALTRFPNDPGIRSDYGWRAQIAGEWPEATRRWREMRECHPDHPVGYTAGAVALREQRRFDEADALLAEAIERFPNERAPLIEYAWLATARRDWPQAVARWQQVRTRFPDQTDGYLRGAQALAATWQHEAAEQLLSDGMERFPDDAALAAEHAWSAFHRHELEPAVQRFAALRARFPETLTGYTGGATALRNLFRLAEAEALLDEAQRRFPGEPRILLEHAQLPMFHPLRRERDPEEALRRLAALRARFPDCEDGYVTGIRYLREAGRTDQAEALALTGLERLPDSAALTLEYGSIARDRADWPEAIRRYETAHRRFPDQPGGAIGLAASLAMAGQYEEAEQLLQETIERFPTAVAAFHEFGWVAARRDDWAAALMRWSEGQRRFPDELEFAHRLFEARLRLAESGGSSEAERAPAPTAEADPRAALRDIIMDFESLGGTALGCEFGMFQREFGAEPLGLLRWADMPYDGLIFALENRFDGVGSEEHTELFVNRENSRPEYCTVDRRGFMFMRAFIYEDEMPNERMWKQAERRLRYLKDKLIADLESGSKIFIYRITARNLEPEELARLHVAMRRYGDNMLLYVRYADAPHPNGTVELAAPGLMVGYIDRFKISPEGQLSANPPSSSWMAICTRAHALWQEQAGIRAAAAA